MIKYLISKDGGDLGQAEGNTKIELIPTIIMRVADVFSNLRLIKPKDMMFSYCIQFNPSYKETIKCMLLAMKLEGLPEGTEFYTVDCNSVFDVRSFSSGIAYSSCFYLICR